MATGSLSTRQQKKALLYRAYTSSPTDTQYDPPEDIAVGINGTTPSENDTDLAVNVPIEDGTVNDDGSNQLSGVDGGDNTTDNTSTYKQGAGATENTAQNLIANDTDTNKAWHITDLSVAGVICDGDDYTSIWLYIKDATALAKLTTSDAVEVKLGSTITDYYSKKWDAADIAVGWNFLTLGVLNTNTETGTVAGDIDVLIIEINTNNATDEFVAGDVVYDLLRQWESTDLVKAFSAGYPSLDLINLEVTMKATLLSSEANGFLLDSAGTKNNDSYLMDLHVHSSESKSTTDEFVYTIKDRII